MRCCSSPRRSSTWYCSSQGSSPSLRSPARARPRVAAGARGRSRRPRRAGERHRAGSALDRDLPSAKRGGGGLSCGVARSLISTRLTARIVLAVGAARAPRSGTAGRPRRGCVRPCPPAARAPRIPRRARGCRTAPGVNSPGSTARLAFAELHAAPRRSPRRPRRRRTARRRRRTSRTRRTRASWPCTRSAPATSSESATGWPGLTSGGSATIASTRGASIRLGSGKSGSSTHAHEHAAPQHAIAASSSHAASSQHPLHADRRQERQARAAPALA